MRTFHGIPHYLWFVIGDKTNLPSDFILKSKGKGTMW